MSLQTDKRKLVASSLTCVLDLNLMQLAIFRILSWARDLGKSTAILSRI
jgi:hypothetical protein